MSQLGERTRDWLLGNRSELDTPEHFFDARWLKHKAVCIGERHFDGAHRDFIAGRVKRWGAPNIGLALEIVSSQQGELTKFMETGRMPSGQWFSEQPRFQSILNAARETKTAVVAMDQEQKTIRTDSGLALSAGRVDRDAHMSNAITQLTQSKSKVLVLVGMEHAREAGMERTSPMGMKLTKTLGSAVCTICAMTPEGHGDDAFFRLMRGAFAGQKAIAFDVDRSPLAEEKIVDPGAKLFVRWADYCDGLMLFF